MKICSSCGSTSAEENRFCNDCGTPFPAAEVLKVKEEPVVAEVKLQENKPLEQEKITRQAKKSNRKSKIVLIAAAILLVALGTTHMVLKNKYDPEKALLQADRAFATEDYSNFFNYFTVDNDVVVDEKSFYQYVKDEDWTDTIHPSIRESIRAIQSGRYPEPITDDAGNKLFTIMDEKAFLFYKKYSVKLHPVAVAVNSSEPQIVVTYGEEQTATVKEDKVTLGKFTPGIHVFKAQVKDSFSTLTSKYEENIVGSGDNEKNVFFDFEERRIVFDSDYKDAVIVVDGKNLAQSASTINLVSIPFDGTIKIHGEYGEGNNKKKSDVVQVTSKNVRLVFADYQQKEQEQKAKAAKEKGKKELLEQYEYVARDLFYSFRSDYVYALNEGNFSYVQNYFLDGSTVKTNYRKFVLEHNDFDYLYYYDFLSNDVIRVTAISENTLKLISYETFRFHTDIDGTYHYERQKAYTMKKDGSQLKIVGIEDDAAMVKKKID